MFIGIKNPIAFVEQLQALTLANVKVTIDQQQKATEAFVKLTEDAFKKQREFLAHFSY